MPELFLRWDAANRLGVHPAKLDRLRLRGLIPEAVRVGHYFAFPADKLDAIKQRLVEQGHIKTVQPEAVAHAG